MAVVVFDATEFRTLYPAFTDESAYPNATLAAYFNQGTEFIGNNDNSLVPYNPSATPAVTVRKSALYATTCHLLTLLSGSGATSPNGAIASASEGSVSTSFQLITGQSQSAQWWNQTRCGAIAYLMIRKYILGGRLYSVKEYHPFG